MEVEEIVEVVEVVEVEDDLSGNYHIMRLLYRAGQLVLSQNSRIK